MGQSSRGSIFQAADQLKWIRSADISDMDSIAKDIRSFLIEKVSKSGGHLGPNLGVVELTIALHPCEVALMRPTPETFSTNFVLFAGMS